MIIVLDGTTLIPYVLYLLFNLADDCERNAMFDYLETYIVRRIICKTSNNNYTDLFTEHLIGRNITNVASLKEYIESRKANDKNNGTNKLEDEVIISSMGMKKR